MAQIFVAFSEKLNFIKENWYSSDCEYVYKSDCAFKENFNDKFYLDQFYLGFLNLVTGKFPMNQQNIKHNLTNRGFFQTQFRFSTEIYALKNYIKSCESIEVQL